MFVYMLCTYVVYHTCLWVHIRVSSIEARGGHWVLCAIALHSIPMRQGLSLNLELD